MLSSTMAVPPAMPSLSLQLTSNGGLEDPAPASAVVGSVGSDTAGYRPLTTRSETECCQAVNHRESRLVVTADQEAQHETEAKYTEHPADEKSAFSWTCQERVVGHQQWLTDLWY